MLIEFNVENDRSIRNKATLSAVSNYLPKDDEEVGQPLVVPEFDFTLVPVIGIFGPNASGKTTLLRALNDCLNLITGRRWDPDSLRPFLLDESTLGQPTIFHLKAFAGTGVYEYDLAISAKQVWLEKLYFRPSTTKSLRRLFERTWNPSKGMHDWATPGKDFEGPHVQLQNNLSIERTYLGFIAESLKVPIVQPLVEWARRRLPVVYTSSDSHLEQFVCSAIEKVDGAKDCVLETLRRFDTRIADFEVKKNEGSSTGKRFEILITPEGSKKKVKWPLQDESHGNRRLFQLSLNLSMALQVGGLFIIDEISSGFHPAISEQLIKLFHDPSTNKGSGQLIFASHDSRHLSRNLLRRDEIWFTKRGKDLATNLYPLTDFDIRGDLAIPRAYLDGRFDALPEIAEFDEWRRQRQDLSAMPQETLNLNGVSGV